MEASELRIGNYINEIGLDYNSEGMPFSDVNDLELVVVNIEVLNNIDKSDYTTDFPRYKPIPLTEEWLLKFGFKKTNKSEEVEWYAYDNFEVSTYNEGETVYFVYQHLVLRHVLSVHQLQNLYFALTNKELTL